MSFFGLPMALRALLFALFALLLSTAAEAAPLNTGHVETELISSRAAIAPGEHFTVLLRQKMASGWHTYWRNPGDSGEPTTLAWHLPVGFSAAPMQWPAPERMPFSILVVYVYSGEVLFPVEITAPRNLAVGRDVTLSADVSWLVCSDVCIPEQGTLSLTVHVAAQGRDNLAAASQLSAAHSSVPRLDPWPARITPGGASRLSLVFEGAEHITNPEFFAYDRDATDHDAPNVASYGSNGLSFKLKAGVDNNLGHAPLDGIVAYMGEDGARRAIEIHATPGAPLANTTGSAAIVTQDAANTAVANSAAPASAPSAGLLGGVLLAFLGGLVLNIMPCVLPVLSIKALSFAGGVHSGRAPREGFFYLIGVLATFLALALTLIALREGGAAAGWGFQLQVPLVCAGLALLFFAIGLNLLGVFEVVGFQGAGADLAKSGGDLGAFFTGALAVVAATPCTAPFMAGAIGIALTQSAAATLLIFTALALGFAAPLTLLAFVPGLQRLLPKPGQWMERAKQALAFPMFATAAWLAWVLSEQAGTGAALALSALAIALGFALLVSRWGRIWLAIGLIALLLTGAIAWRPLTGHGAAEALASEPWSATRVASLRAEGRGVFVNFTADWCVSCKVNEALALSPPRVAAAFAQNNVAYLKADWTRRDPAIAAELAARGRAGVPLYLYYAPGRDAVALPQLLTEAAVLDAIGARD